MLANGMKLKGHEVDIWQPKARIFNWPMPKFLKKWAGYMDQFILFPIEVKKKIKSSPKNTLYVFIDNALGPWVPLVSHLPNVIHCHDFMAQKSGLGKIEENRISWTGKLYQKFIRKGYLIGSNYISVSERTREDLENVLLTKPLISEVVYNGINSEFHFVNKELARTELANKLNSNLAQGFILHVGGNLWYKNRKGVIEIYESWRALGTNNLPLLLIGEPANTQIETMINNSDYKKDIIIKSKLDIKILNLAYNGASLFLFPSLEEGFGWPIAEAMVAGVPVLTTNEKPMTEVGGEAAFYIPRRPYNEKEAIQWRLHGANKINEILNLSNLELNNISSKDFENIKRFDLQLNLDRIENIYKKIIVE